MSQRPIREVVPSLSDMPPQHAEWLIDSLLPQGSLTVVAGKPGSGKSTWILGMCGAITQGKSFAGLQTKFAPVLYLDRENPHVVAQSRVKEQGISTNNNFLYWGSWVSEDPLPVFDTRLMAYVEECEPKPLIVIDSLSSFYRGDENDSTSIRNWFSFLRPLAAKGASVIVIHHSGKAETAQMYRGSSDIEAAVDLGYHLSNKSKTKVLDTLFLKSFKTRLLVLDEQLFSYKQGQFRCEQAMSKSLISGNGMKV